MDPANKFPIHQQEQRTLASKQSVDPRRPPVQQRDRMMKQLKERLEAMDDALDTNPAAIATATQNGMIQS